MGPIVMSRVAEDHRRDIAKAIAANRLAAQTGRRNASRRRSFVSVGDALRALRQRRRHTVTRPVPVG